MIHKKSLFASLIYLLLPRNNRFNLFLMLMQTVFEFKSVNYKRISLHIFVNEKNTHLLLRMICSNNHTARKLSLKMTIIIIIFISKTYFWSYHMVIIEDVVLSILRNLVVYQSQRWIFYPLYEPKLSISCRRRIFVLPIGLWCVPYDVYLVMMYVVTDIVRYKES